MSRPLYEQYKEALRRGHLAALRDRLDVAEASYRAAAAIAPDRVLPYTSLAGVLRRQGRLGDALEAFSAALIRAPEDEAALRGRGELLADVGRRADAAHDFEVLAGILEGAGRLLDACDAARRALELAESRSRRREVERLSARLRDRAGDRAALDALDRALLVLEGVGDSAPSADRKAPDGPRNGHSAPEDGPARPRPAGDETGVPAESAPLPSDRPAPTAPPDPSALRAAADELLDRGDIAGASRRLLELAALHRAEGRRDAAMDACLALLAVAPADHRLQREIAAIQLDRGWTQAAAEKLRLLARLAELDGDAEAGAALVAFAAERRLGLSKAARAGD